MKLSRRTNTIVLWVLAIALLVGMIVMFTPTMGNLGGQRDTSTPALYVNGEPITELEVARAQQGTLYSRVREGEAARDLELLLLDQLIQQEVLKQAAARTNVSGGEVRQAVNEFREQNGVAGRNNDEAYLNLIGRVGFTDASFRDYMRDQLRLEKYQAQLTEDVTVDEAEVEAYYELNQDAYQRDERIVARVLVVDDVQRAAELRQQIEGGADFAEIASEHSLDRADRGGALGAPAGSTEPQPVGRAALPSEVAAVAFGMQGPGLTEPVVSGSRVYVVQVEEYLPAEAQPLEEVREQVQADALAAKQGRVLEEHIASLREQATVTPAEGSQYSFENPVVARVADNEIMQTDLIRATYTNPQIQQALGPENADLIAQFFKPTILSQLIDREVAYVGAQQLEAEFIGPKALVAQDALAWVSRDVSATEEELQAYYESNQARFTVPAEAEVTRVEFADAAAAEGFRSALVAGAEPQAAAEEFGGELEDRGTVMEGELEQALDAAVFGTDAFEPLPDGESEVSDVLVVQEPAPDGAGESAEGAEASAADETAETGEGEAAEDAAEGEAGDGTPGDEPAADAEPQTVDRFVVVVAERTPERVRPFEEVRAQVEQAVLSRKRAEAQAAWLESLREEIQVVNLLAQVEESEGGAPADGASDAAGDQPAGDDASEAAAEGGSDGAAEPAGAPEGGSGGEAEPAEPSDAEAAEADPPMMAPADAEVDAPAEEAPAEEAPTGQ